MGLGILAVLAEDPAERAPERAVELVASRAPASIAQDRVPQRCDQCAASACERQRGDPLRGCRRGAMRSLSRLASCDLAALGGRELGAVGRGRPWWCGDRGLPAL